MTADLLKIRASDIYSIFDSLLGDVEIAGPDIKRVVVIDIYAISKTSNRAITSVHRNFYRVVWNRPLAHQKSRATVRFGCGDKHDDADQNHRPKNPQRRKREDGVHNKIFSRELNKLLKKLCDFNNERDGRKRRQLASEKASP